MEVIPAIDLQNGRCVRLYKGDFDRETIFSDDPIEVALRWESEGAPRLHIVDLDGAREGIPKNIDLVKRIATTVKLPVQVGGGVRSMSQIADLLDSNVDRIILGTIAIESPNFVEDAVEEYSQRVIVGVDAREGKVSIRGWQQESGITPEELVQQMKQKGVERFIYTDITRDGTLTQPNFTVVRTMRDLTLRRLIASGGIAQISHLTQLAALDIEGAIVGRALYTGAFTLSAALESVKIG